MGGWNAGPAGLKPERVAELLVTPAGPGPRRRGSGYRVTASAVLTAAHVVQHASRVCVRFSADKPSEWMPEGTVAWSDPEIDVAVITIPPRAGEEEKIKPVEFGRVTDQDAALTYSAMGFPQFKLRKDSAQPRDDGYPSQYRDTAHAMGTIAVLSNWREGTLELMVGPPRGSRTKGSPWGGMSGAAVWSASRIIGLIAEHHIPDGLGRLAATRVDLWHERLTADRMDELRRLLPQLPARKDGLVEVIPGPPGELPAELAWPPGTLALAPDVRDGYLKTFAGEPAVKTPVDWTLAELSGLQQEAAASGQGPSKVMDALSALCDALRARKVFQVIGDKALELDQLQVIYQREVGAWPDGGSSDALLVEAANASIVERRRRSSSARPLSALARFVLGVAAVLGVPPEENDVLAEWIGSLGHQLAGAQRYYLNRWGKTVWLIIDLGKEPPADPGNPPRPGDISWPTEVAWTRVAGNDEPEPEQPVTCEPSEDGLKHALGEILRLAHPARSVLVDLAVPRALMDAGIEHWPIIEVGGQMEPLSGNFHPRLRWSMRRHDEWLHNRLLDRIETGSWKGGPKNWLCNDPSRACFLGGADAQPSSTDPLGVLLREGCGFVIWFPAGLSESAMREIAKAVRKLKVGARRHDLPDRLPAFSQGHPVIIWDDPRGRGEFRMPPGAKPESP